MTPQDFCYWLRGFSELNSDLETLTPLQWRIIQDHLQLVFRKETPDRVQGPSLEELIQNMNQEKEQAPSQWREIQPPYSLEDQPHFPAITC